jgi:hypothetical protein
MHVKSKNKLGEVPDDAAALQKNVIGFAAGRSVAKPLPRRWPTAAVPACVPPPGEAIGWAHSLPSTRERAPTPIMASYDLGECISRAIASSANGLD